MVLGDHHDPCYRTREGGKVKKKNPKSQTHKEKSTVPDVFYLFGAPSKELSRSCFPALFRTLSACDEGKYINIIPQGGRSSARSHKQNVSG